MASNRQQRIQLEKRGIAAEKLKKYQLYNSDQLIARQKEDRYLEQHGMLDYQGGGSYRPSQQTTTQQPQPGVITGTTDKFVDPITGKSYFSPGIQYTVPTQGGVQTRESHQTIWLNGNPADRNKLLTGTGQPTFATTDAVKSGTAAWNDVESTQREKILSDPNFYKNGGITQFPVAVRDQILNDPNFNWQQLPRWQKTFHSIISNPKIMASPMALAGAHAGGIFGPVGKVAGAAIGYGLGVVGGQEYDPTRGVFDQPSATAGLMAVLNKLSEGAEQTTGYTAQLLDAAIAGAQGNQQAAAAAEKMVTDPAYRKATWEAGRFAYEASDFMGARNWIPGIARLLGDETAVLAKPGQDFVVGSATPINRAVAQGFNPVTGNFYDVNDAMGILQEARLTIHKAIQNGEDPRDVVRQIMGEQGQYVGATVADFAGQAAIDPLEYLPEVTAKTTSKLASLIGNETAARAFSEAKAPVEGLRRYQTLVQTGDVAPGFDYSKMSSVSRWVAGLNEAGQIKAGPFTQTGLLDKPAKQANLWSKLKEDWAALTPEARAREGANMFYNNLGALLSTFDDPHEISKFMGTLSKGDMKVWAEMGNKIAQSPEWYTILPALKDFDSAKIDGPLAAWDLAQPQRDMLVRIADTLGEEPGTFIEDLAKRGSTEQDFQRLTERLQQSTDPGAKDLLADIQRGEFTKDNLKQMVDVFTGEGALPWHPDQWKAMLMDSLGQHFDQWAVDKLGLGKGTPESKAFFRTTHLLKSAQSVLLLGGSPGYALQNGMSNMVHRAATGIYGYMTPRQIDGWLERFGVTPARLEEGVGIGGEVEQAASKSSVQTEAIQKAVKGNQNDALGRAQRIVSAIGRGMPFNKLSSAFERLEGKNGYMIAMRDMWSQTWRRGHGFAEVTPELKEHLQGAGINPNSLYALIEAGMNKDEIERFVYGRQQGIMSRTLVNDAAQKLGIPSTSAARLLEKVGVLDELDRLLAKADTPDKVRGAFTQATRRAQDFQDMQTSRDLKAMAEQVTNKVQAEGAPAALDVVQRVNGEYFDAWLDHYSRFGEMFDELRSIPDQAVRDKAIDLNYRISDQEFRRINARTAANYQGIFEAWGKSRNPRAMEILAAVAQSDAAMKQAYDFMRTERRSFFDRLRENADAIPAGEWDKVQTRIDAEFERAFKAKHNAEVQMGESLGKIHEELHGPAAGEAARKWWEDYTKFSDEIVKREKEFRKSLTNLDKDAREAARQKYYSTDKVAQIAELERINQEGIQRLERVIKNGRGGQPSAVSHQPSGTPPAPSSTMRTGRGADEVNTLIADAEQRTKQETAAKAEKVSSVWDVAEDYARVGLPYDRTILQDRFALLGALRKEEYGGIPDIKGLDDERLTTEKVRSILDERSKVKANEEAAKMDKALATIPAPKITDNTSILQAIKEHGGLNAELAADLTGDTPRRTPGVFRKKGIQMDEMARMLADDGYPIDLNDPNDPGGIRQATDLLNRARHGDKVYPAGHDFEAEIRRAEEAYAKVQAEDAERFDMALWQKDLEDATASGDLTKMYEKIGELPEELNNEKAPSGETWTEWMSRVADETAARVEEANRDQAVTDAQARINRDTASMEERGNAMQTKRILEEKFKDVFGLTDEQAAAYMELSESIAEWYTRATGESGDAFYSRYYEDVVSGGEGDLFQIEPVNRRMTAQEVGDYARALVRSGADELRRAVVNENVKADRIAILDAAHQINPQLAESVARRVSDQLFQEAFGQGAKKGAVTFDATGIRATIHAFEAKDFSTLIHENAHVFRRVLSDVATRTGNSKVLADLATIEEWAGVKDGNWTREHEEKFARGFERYVTEGEAPTPKLKRAFESFKSWMLQVYKQITGSAIDVNLTDEVRGVFNRMLGEEKPVERMLGDRRQPAHKQLRDAWGTLDKTQQQEVIDWIFKKTLVDPLSGLETLVAKEIEGAKPAGWVEATSDLNALTAINNTWGHDIGDDIIARIGKIAKAEVEKVGGRAFRQGGDEFTYWFPTEEAARSALDAIDKAVPEEVFTIGGVKRKGFTVSYGIGDTRAAVEAELHTDKARRIDLGQRPVVRDQMPGSIQTLFQDAMPNGTMEDASGFKADSEWQDAGWKTHVRPLLDAMQTVALDKMTNERPLDGAYKDMSPEGQQMLRSYINQVKNDMGAVKNSTIKWGESQRDFAMLNYNRRYGFDRYLEAVAPYQLYYTRSLMTWAARGLDKPAWFANFARVRNLQNKHERDVPERLRNKFRIPAPWLPKWMGDALYIDPISNLFTPANFLRPFEQMMKDKNMQQIEAERVLQEWAKDGQVSQDQITQAARDQSGSLWERAFAEAQTRREAEISNPFDFMATMFGPAWYLSTPLNLAGVKVPFLSKGERNKVTPTPLLNTARALEATTKGTFAEPIGQFFSALGKPEEMIRKRLGLPEFGEFGDYYVDRQLSNMVAEGLIDAQQAQQAMIERNGALFDQARERVKLELAMRTPLASSTYALTHEGAVAGAKSFLPSLFGSGLLPSGELEYRGLKSEWNEAWKKYDAGDKTAVNNFFDEHPEYSAYLAKGKPPEERLKSFLIGNIWDAYMALGPTNQKQARAEMGDEFSRSFLDKETRSYDSLDVQTLTQWTQMLGALAPRTPETAPVLDIPKAQQPKLNLFDPRLTQVTDEFFNQRTKYYGNYYELEQGYYALPKSQRGGYLLKNPELKDYWQWKDKWMKSYPDLQPILKGQVFKRVDTSAWPPGLTDYVNMYAYSGKKLPKGAYKALEQQWILEGQPLGNLNSWLNSTVVPAMLYGNQ